MTGVRDGLRSQAPRLDPDCLPVVLNKSPELICLTSKGAEPSVIGQAVSIMHSETWVGFSGLHFSGSAPGVDI